MEKDEDCMQVLTDHRVSLVHNLQVERTFLFDYLISKSVIDKNDYDLVKAEKTREQKASKFLDIIETKGEEGLKHFKDALQLINPSLYEKLTGEKATVRSNPIVEALNNILGDESRFIDQDILSSHLKRVTDDLRDITLRYNHLLKDDHELRKALQKASRERDDAEQRAESLGKLLENAQTAMCETHSSANMCLIHQYETMQKDRDDTKDFIIQLQMKLLQSQEEAEKWTRELEACRTKCDDLAQELAQVNQHYTLQRCETQRLSARLINQKEELGAHETLKLKFREKQFQIAEMKCSLEEKDKELEEVKNWTEALKNRYDATVRKRDELYASQRKIEDKLFQAESEVYEIEIKSNRLIRENEELKKDREKLQQEANVFKKQAESHRESYLQVVKKQDEVKSYVAEQLEIKDKELERTGECVVHFERLLEETKAELRATKAEMSTTTAQNDELLSKLNQLRVDYEILKTEMCNNTKEADDTMDGNQTASEENCVTNGEQCVTGYDSNAWKQRSTTDLLNSIRRRFVKSNSSSSDKPTPTVWRRSLSFDSWLSNLTPAYKGLSTAAKDSYSLDRQSHLSHALSYETISYMMNPGASTEGSEAGSPTNPYNSLPSFSKFYNRERLRGIRKFSSPLPLNAEEVKILSVKNPGIGEEEQTKSVRSTSGEEEEKEAEEDSTKKSTANEVDKDHYNPFRPRCQGMRASLRKTRKPQLTRQERGYESS